MKIDIIAENQRLEFMTCYEQDLWQEGNVHIAGVDEAGRGPLAGPVVAAAVILSKEDIYILGLNDSKKISAPKRQVLYHEIKNRALAYAIAWADHNEIDKINILQATKLAMTRAIDLLEIKPQHVLIDALVLQNLALPQTAIIRGDSLSVSIAAASILAKCKRDEIMEDYNLIYPNYGFAKHKGYPTKEHYDSLAKYGPCHIHRCSFRLA